MCFSASASFAASGSLGIFGILILRKSKKDKDLLLATIPFIFATQQFIEGWLWVSMGRNSELVMALTYAFLFFALFWWPAYVPLVCYYLEADKARKNILQVLAWIGFLLGMYLYGNFIWHSVPATVVNKCIFYVNPLFKPINLILFLFYAVVTVGALVISGKKIINLFGVLAGLLAAFSLWIYLKNFISVWCFFGALVSSVLYFYFLKREK